MHLHPVFLIPYPAAPPHGGSTLFPDHAVFSVEMAAISGNSLAEIAIFPGKNLIHVDEVDGFLIHHGLDAIIDLLQIGQTKVPGTVGFSIAHRHDPLENDLGIRLLLPNQRHQFSILPKKIIQIKARFIQTQADKDLVILFAFQKAFQILRGKILIRTPIMPHAEYRHANLAEVIRLSGPGQIPEGTGSGVPNKQGISEPSIRYPGPVKQELPASGVAECNLIGKRRNGFRHCGFRRFRFRRQSRRFRGLRQNRLHRHSTRQLQCQIFRLNFLQMRLKFRILHQDHRQCSCRIVPVVVPFTQNPIFQINTQSREQYSRHRKQPEHYVQSFLH